jgi:hypothetical protein
MLSYGSCPIGPEFSQATEPAAVTKTVSRAT